MSASSSTVGPSACLRGTTIWDAARTAGVAIPALCHSPGFEPVGVCRVCAVEVEGSRTLVAACVREVEAGMVVRTGSERIGHARRILTELLLSEQPATSAREQTTGDDALLALARDLSASDDLPRFAPASARGHDDSSRVIAVDHRLASSVTVASVPATRCSTTM